ncbi:MAG: cadmium-translocating P-type ATPase [Bacilli bacterium]|nr:cadmium-translocating P-type ATPase [Bacilli bacterium]
MERKVFNVSGFDCPVCATKAERYLNKQEDVESARMDFTNNKLYITFKNDAWDCKKLAKVIGKVETNPLNISEVSNNANGKVKVFDKRMKILLVRIIAVVLISLLNIFFLAKEDLTILRTVLYSIAIVAIGYDVTYRVLCHIKNRSNILDHNLLITVAAIGAFVISILEINEEHIMHLGSIHIAMDDGMEAVMVITLFQVGQIIEAVATNKSKAAVMSAVELRVDTAQKITPDGVVTVKPEELEIGDKIIVTNGELIPIDGEVIDGEAYVDTSSLTGEFVPVLAVENSLVYSGCSIKSGSLTVRVSKKYEDSAVSKIIQLISNGGEQKTKADEFIAKFARIYTPLVVGIAIVTFLIGGLISQDWETWVHTGLEILVIGCPCAIVISVPLAFFSAIGLASKNGIVIKGANYLDKLIDMGVLITDKTGTLTHGSFQINKVEAVNGNKEELLEYLYAAECLSKHPIGKAICHDIKTNNFANRVTDFNEIAGYGITVTFEGKKVVAGGEKLLKQEGIDLEPVVENGTIVYCAVDGKYVGYIALSDVIKDNAQPMVNLLHSKNINILLLTGDKEENAKQICNKLGIDRWYSELLPEDKMKYLEKEISSNKKAVAFIGDGINDAPSIIRSDIGIAMGGMGSDIAVENADIIIMNDDPAKVYDAINIAGKARNTSLFNIFFALAIKLAVYILALFFGKESWMMYVAILADTGLTVLLVLNSLLLLYRKVKRKIV